MLAAACLSSVIPVPVRGSSGPSSRGRGAAAPAARRGRLARRNAAPAPDETTGVFRFQFEDQFEAVGQEGAGAAVGAAAAAAEEEREEDDRASAQAVATAEREVAAAEEELAAAEEETRVLGGLFDIPIGGLVTMEEAGAAVGAQAAAAAEGEDDEGYSAQAVATAELEEAAAEYEARVAMATEAAKQEGRGHTEEEAAAAVVLKAAAAVAAAEDEEAEWASAQAAATAGREQAAAEYEARVAMAVAEAVKEGCGHTDATGWAAGPTLPAGIASLATAAAGPSLSLSVFPSLNSSRLRPGSTLTSHLIPQKCSSALVPTEKNT